MKITIIVPCYNEEEVLRMSYARVLAVCENADYDYEILFINDGSKDGTMQILEELSAQNKNVKVLSFSRNFGHQCAVTAGINHATGDVAVIIDADLQDPPEVIPQMLQLMHSEHANVVYGVRKHRKGEPYLRLAAIKIYYRFLNLLSNIKIPVDTGDFRMIDRKIIEQFNMLTESNKYVRGLIAWMGYKQVPCYYERDARYAGETKYPLRKLWHLGMTGIFYFSKKPLTIATSLGTLCIVLGILYVMQILAFRILGFANNIVSGWTSTIVTIVFFGGVQLLTIGILGKYIGNLFDETKQRPEYIVDRKYNF